MNTTSNPKAQTNTSTSNTNQGVKNTLLQPTTPQYKAVATLTTSLTGTVEVVKVSADLHIEPKDSELVAPSSVVKQRIGGKLEHGKRSATNAVVLHMTGFKAQSVFNAYAHARAPGAHFLITKTGEIIQTAKLNYMAWHVGPVRPKGYRPAGDKASKEVKELLTDDETRELRDTGKSYSEKMKELHRLQLKKPYGSDPNDKNTRYPSNEDSIGIEFESLSDEKTKPKTQVNVNYEDLTEKQIESGRKLLKFLKDHYKLTDADIYEHPDISYKSQDEARGTKELVK